MSRSHCRALFYGAILGVLFLRLQAIWPVGFHQDNAMASNWLAGAHRDGLSLFGFCHEMFARLVSKTGRFIPVVTHVLAPVQIAFGENLTALRCFQAGSQISAFLTFALFIRRLSRDGWLAGTIIVLFASIYELRDYHDPAFGVGVLLPALVCLGSLSCFFALRCAEDDRERWSLNWGLAAVFSLLNMLTWELALPFSVLACCILLTGSAPRQLRWLRAAVAGLGPLILTVVGLWLKRTSSYSGTTLGDLQPSVVGRTFLEQATSALPLSYQHFDPQRIFPPGWTAHADNFTAVAIGVLAAVAVGVGIRETQPKRLRSIFFTGGLFLVAPPLMLSVSARYQKDSAPGLGYTQTSLTYIGVCILVVASLVWLRNAIAIRWRIMSAAPGWLAAVLAGLIAGQTLLGSTWMADYLNQRWRYPREMFAVWLEATRSSPSSPRLLVVEHPWLSRWQNADFAFEHLGTRSEFITRRDFDAARGKAAAGTAVVDLSFTPLVERSGRGVVIAATSDGAPAERKLRLSVFLISADWYALASVPFRLEKGAQSWLVPDPVVVGFRGYYYRRLEFETDSPSVEGYRLVLN